MKSTPRPIVLVLVAGLFAWFFADALFSSGMFCFRDAAHFYYPLFSFCADEWSAGRVPLWNPYENLGQPLAGNAAASVFYPGKLIFAAPIDYAWAYKIYVTAHVLLAAWGAYRLARHFGTSVAAAGVCAISYAFSGNVLYQYCNVVFLVGAAWLPLSLLAADRMLLERSVRSAVVFGVVLALMTLGGDPQMAYNAALLTAIYALTKRGSPRNLGEGAMGGLPALAEPSKDKGGQAAQGTPIGHISWLLRTSPVLLAIAATTGLILSAVQVLPSLEFTAHSGRVAERSAADALLGRFEPGTHQEHVYHFSVGPWRLAEYVWPNVSGRQLPVNSRWLEVIPGEGRIWTPSLYMGVVPLLLALGALRLRRRRGEPNDDETRDRWLSWAAVLAVAASFGYFGVGWLIQEIRFAAGADVAGQCPFGEPFGGVYWLMTLVLPGYSWFRYPAKLLVVAALGLSVLTARGWDRAFEGQPDRLRRVLLGLCGLSVCGAIASWAIRPLLGGWLADVPPDMLFGPLDVSKAAGDLRFAFLQTAVVSGLFWWLLGRAAAGRWAAVAGLVLVALDLAVANRWMVVCAPQSIWESKSKAATALEADRSAGELTSGRVFRRSLWLPDRWRTTSSTDRLAEAVRWDRDTLWPKYNLADRISLAEVHGTMMLEDYRRFLAGEDADFRAGGEKAPVALSLATYVILRGDETLPGGRPVEIDAEDVSLWYNPRHLPRAWIEYGPSTAEGGSPIFAARKSGRSPSRPPVAPEPCRVVHRDPMRVEIEAKLSRPGVVVSCEQFYPGWELAVETTGQPPHSAAIARVNGVMRGVQLPAGEHRLTYSYRPASFIWGAILSGLGWLGLAAWGGKRAMAAR